VALLVADLAGRSADVTSSVTVYVYPRPVPMRGFASPPPGEFVAPSCLMHTLAAAVQAAPTSRPPSRAGSSGARSSRARWLPASRSSRSAR
jgi:hypothetical protein